LYCIEKCIIKPQIEKEENKADDDSSFIFCFDNSGSKNWWKIKGKI
jgi:hypothetical protein